MENLKKLGEERENIINYAYSDPVKYEYPVNKLAKELHPQSKK